MSNQEYTPLTTHIDAEALSEYGLPEKPIIFHFYGDLFAVYHAAQGVVLAENIRDGTWRFGVVTSLDPVKSQRQLDMILRFNLVAASRLEGLCKDPQSLFEESIESEK